MTSAAAGPGSATTSLVIPSYNPGPLLRTTWEKVRDFLAEAPGQWEVVFVCDGSTDGTPQELSGWANDYLGRGRVRVLRYPANRGKGYAVCRGLAAACGRWRLFTDVDLAYAFDDVLRVARALWAGAPAAIASRWHPASTVQTPPHLRWYVYRRHLQSRVFAQVVRRLLPLGVRDTQAGLKGFRADVLRRILPRVCSRGFEFDCELLTACVRLGVPVTELPVCVRYDGAASTTGLLSGVRMVRGLWRIRRNWPAAAPLPARPAARPALQAAA